jgi:SET domain-containing protein
MLLVSTTVKLSPIHGLGCFTNEQIQKGQLVWQFDERLDRRIAAADLAALPQPAQDFIRMYAYRETYRGQDAFTLCGDHAKHMNHSDQANLVSTGPDLERDVAIRDIEIGEELTCNYNEFDLDIAHKLAPTS